MQNISPLFHIQMSFFFVPFSIKRIQQLALETNFYSHIQSNKNNKQHKIQSF